MTGFDARYDTLKARFVTRCASDLLVLEQALEGLADREQLRMTVHRMAGAAGTFGYHDLSRLAGAIDDRLVAGQDPDRSELVALVEAVRVLARD